MSIFCHCFTNYYFYRLGCHLFNIILYLKWEESVLLHACAAHCASTCSLPDWLTLQSFQVVLGGCWHTEPRMGRPEIKTLFVNVLFLNFFYTCKLFVKETTHSSVRLTCTLHYLALHPFGLQWFASGRVLKWSGRVANWSRRFTNWSSSVAKYSSRVSNWSLAVPICSSRVTNWSSSVPKWSAESPNGLVGSQNGQVEFLNGPAGSLNNLIESPNGLVGSTNDPNCFIFFKSRRFKDIKYDAHNYI